MTLKKLLVCVAVFFAVIALVNLLGFGLAFGFAANVLVPWLGVSAAWTHAATLIGAILMTGAFSALLTIVLVVLFAWWSARKLGSL